MQGFQSGEIRIQAQRELPLAQVQGWEEGVTSSSLSYTFLDYLDNEEEGEEAIS